MWNQLTFFTVILNFVVAGLHIITGESHDSKIWVFINGYLIDILLPFSVYFLITLKIAPLKKKIYAGVILFIATVTVEVMQYLGYPLLGCRFDWLDFIAYFSGILGAILLDYFVIIKHFDKAEK